MNRIEDILRNAVYGPVPEIQQDYPEGPVRITDPRHLRDLASHCQIRPDWHEPVNQGISARIVGTHLDNANGPTTLLAGRDFEEFNVILSLQVEYMPKCFYTVDLAVINLATLLSWGTDLGRFLDSPGGKTDA